MRSLRSKCPNHLRFCVLQDSLDTLLLNQTVGTLGPHNRTFAFGQGFVAMQGLLCEQTPEVTNALMRLERVNQISLTIGTVYGTSDGRYHEFDSTRVYRSINSRDYFYYEHPEFNQVW